MPYDIDRIHAPKRYCDRRQGKTVSALANAIGKLMVTENETIFIIVSELDRANSMRREYKIFLIEHYNEEPTFKSNTEWGIKGYTGRIIVVSLDDPNIEYYERSPVEPVYYLDNNMRNNIDRPFGGKKLNPNYLKKY